ncbi:hypothetical protein LTR10_013063 [Elasticomyces elasticus]|uniref:Uncharacterized protein n=1 Tax=Exophiala sideris TaxID=1016849 RepID=A0ABR0JB00_9EURO|nr:hypothetical protein LTR10_013063 [Elasticomyces elasticus]KAK5030439.1 hypothetical protein LTS07_005223 [Exophiala sideris]KAK5038492.1 hypothetical protein LTR13_004239 [Exophiala sideris]KAK5060375.1 hypothetical protein LTR69_005692 [Exophiala sideris]KAK5183285.1 hypothetical protein LTR44_004286 [Eurotiomycetes sp. CCFEE 6388]
MIRLEDVTRLGPPAEERLVAYENAAKEAGLASSISTLTYSQSGNGQVTTGPHSPADCLVVRPWARCEVLLFSNIIDEESPGKVPVQISGPSPTKPKRIYEPPFRLASEIDAVARFGDLQQHLDKLLNHPNLTINAKKYARNLSSGIKEYNEASGKSKNPHRNSAHEQDGLPSSRNVLGLMIGSAGVSTDRQIPHNSTLSSSSVSDQQEVQLLDGFFDLEQITTLARCKNPRCAEMYRELKATGSSSYIPARKPALLVPTDIARHETVSLGVETNLHELLQAALNKDTYLHRMVFVVVCAPSPPATPKMTMSCYVMAVGSVLSQDISFPLVTDSSTYRALCIYEVNCRLCLWSKTSAFGR